MPSTLPVHRPSLVNSLHGGPTSPRGCGVPRARNQPTSCSWPRQHETNPWHAHARLASCLVLCRRNLLRATDGPRCSWPPCSCWVGVQALIAARQAQWHRVRPAPCALCGRLPSDDARRRSVCTLSTLLLAGRPLPGRVLTAVASSRITSPGPSHLCAAGCAKEGTARGHRTQSCESTAPHDCTAAHVPHGAQNGVMLGFFVPQPVAIGNFATVQLHDQTPPPSHGPL